MRVASPFSRWIRRSYLTLFVVFVLLFAGDITSMLAGRGRLSSHFEEIYGALFVVLIILQLTMRRFRHGDPARGRGGEVAFSSRTFSGRGVSTRPASRR